MRLADYKALTFDCYGTLIDWESGLVGFLDPWARDRGVALSDEELLTLYGRFEQQREAENPTTVYTEILGLVLVDLAEHFGLTLLDHERGALADSLGDWPPFSDAIDTLQELGRTHQLLVLSNVDRCLFSRSQERLGIEFDAVITAEDVGSYKPAPNHFLRCFEVLEKQGIRRTEILHVAQSLYHDHVPAKALGMTTCWVDRRADLTGWGATPKPEERVEPDVTVRSLEELLGYR